MKKRTHLVALITLITLGILASDVRASHFRGAAMVPEVSASGVLTVTTTSFWRKGANDQAGISTNQGFMNFQSFSLDTSDSRYDVRTDTHTLQLASSAATIDMTWGSCCRVEANANGGNWLESSWEMNSSIVWDGATATKPIDFNFAAIQPEVNRSSFYSDNLNATSPDGLALSYNQDLNLSITAQPTPSFTIDTSTGALFIPGSDTPLVMDHQSDDGADKAFSGNIIASNGSFVEFDWMFDGVDASSNQAPIVSDDTFNLVAGAVLNYTYTATDPNGDVVTFDPLLFNSAGPTPANAPVYTGGGSLAPFFWDTTGSAPGTYLFQARASDPGGLTDIGTLTVELSAANGAVPEPSSVVIFAGLMGVFLFCLERRRRTAARRTE